MSQFQDLPDEIILKVLSYLDVKDMLCCGQTSKQIRAVSHDESLYQKIDLSGKKVWDRFLERIMNKGCKDLSLNGVWLLGSKFNLNEKSKLRCLNLDWIGFGFGFAVTDFEILIDSCISLQKISMKNLGKLFLKSNMIKSICNQNGQTLRVLNLENCVELSQDQILLITNKCVALKEVNFINAFPTELFPFQCADILTKNLSTNVQNVSLRKCKSVHDWHIDILVKRCNQIHVLDLKGTSIIGTCLPEIIRNLKDTLKELNVQTYGLKLWFDIGNSDKVLELKSLTRLNILNVTVNDFMERRLKKELIGITINNQEYQDDNMYF